MFYAKRVRRILPVFYVVIVTYIIVGYFIMLPKDFTYLAKTVMFSLFFTSNMAFWGSFSDYFSERATEMPFLHFWSLSVEEQFYFIWPFILILLIKLFSKKQITIVIIISIIVLTIATQFLIKYDPNLAYYSLPTRAAELLIGAVLSFVIKYSEKFSIRNLNIMGFAGLITVILSAILISKQSLFPGINALYPCIGAFLIMFSGNNNQTFVSKFLAKRPLVFVGLISYSLYLWHWPIIAFLNYREYQITFIVKISVILLSFVLSILSWKYVEKPIRKIKIVSPVRIIITIFLLPLIAITLLCLVIFTTRGFENRLPQIAGTEFHLPKRSIGFCFPYYIIPKSKDFLNNCHLGNQDSQNKALLLGDSHAGHFEPFINEVGKKYNIDIQILTGTGCPADLTKEKSLSIFSKLCDKVIYSAIENVKNKKYDIIILANRWGGHKLDHLEKTLEIASKNAKKVIIILSVPIFDVNKNASPQKSYLKNFTYETLLQNEADVGNNKIKKIAEKFSNIELLDVAPAFYKNGKVSQFNDNGLPFYLDNHHLNIYGSKHIFEYFEQLSPNKLKEIFYINENIIK